MKMSKDTKGAMIIIGVAIIITVGIFFITRGRKEKETGGEVETEISKKEEEKEEYVDILSDGTKLNTSKTLQRIKTYDGIEMKDFQLTESGNMTLLLGTLTNKTGEEKGGYLVDLIMMDKEGKELGRSALYIKNLKPGESMQLASYAQGEIINAYDFSVAKRGEEAEKK